MSAKPSTVIITGCAGFVGSHAVDRLLASGYRVIGIDNFCAAYDRKIKESNLAPHISPEANPAFQLIEGDASAAETLESLRDCLEGHPVEMILHLAAAPQAATGTAGAEAHFRVNVIVTERLLRLARDLGQPHVIFASTAAIYTHSDATEYAEHASHEIPSDIFALTKFMGEQIGRIYAELFGSRFSALRFAPVYGPRQRPGTAIYRYLEKVMQEGDLPPLDSEYHIPASTNLIHIHDLIDGILQAHTHCGQPFEIINLAGTEPTHPMTLLTTMSRIFGVAPSESTLQCMKDNPIPQIDLTKAKQLFNFDPKTDFGEGTRQLILWFIEHQTQFPK